MNNDEMFYTTNDNHPLSADAVDAIGLDSTGIDGDPRFPYTYASLSVEEKVIVHAYWATIGKSS